MIIPLQLFRADLASPLAKFSQTRRLIFREVDRLNWNTVGMLFSTKHLLLALAVAFVWGINFTAIRAGLTDLPPLLYSALRFVLVAFPLIFFVELPRGFFLMVVQVGALLGVGMFGAMFLALDGEANIVHASIILQSQVPMTMLLAARVFGQKLGPGDYIGILIVALGIAGLIAGSGPGLTGTGAMLLLFGAFSWALANLVFIANPSANSLQIVVWAFALPIIPLFLVSWVVESRAPLALVAASSMTTWLAVAFMAYGSTLFAHVSWGYLIQRYGAQRVVPYALLVPILATLGSAILLAETPTQAEIVFSAIALAGLASCIFKPNWRRLFGRWPVFQKES